MDRKLAVIGIGAWLLVATGCANTYAGSRASVSYRSPGGAVSVSYFYDDLARYGNWVDYGPYGWCWVPANVPPYWRPYEDGYWVFTDYGWAWASYEPWGWATCHYGRWDYDDYYGWIWVPGTVWAPAWVAWHCDDDWIGWAPLPPSAGWNISVGLHFGDVDRIPPPRWCFVPRDRFSQTKLKMHVVSVARNEWLLDHTRDYTRFEVRGGHPVNRGFDPSLIERRDRKKIREFRLVDADSPTRGDGRRSRDTIAYYRPALTEDHFRAGPPEGKRGRSFAVPQAQLKRQHERQVRELERDLSQGRAQLRREQSKELRGVRGAEAHTIRERHANEERSYEKQAVEQRQRLERHRKSVAGAEKSKARSPSPGKGKRGGK